MTAGSLKALLGNSLSSLARSGRAVCVANDLRWGEGPAYLKQEDRWIFSDIPNDRVLTFSESHGLSIFRQPSNFANGHSVTRSGALLACEHLTRCVSVTEFDGARTILCDVFEGRPLNSPNDIVEAPDGAIWFSDPTYGILTDVEGRRAVPEQCRNRVYRYDPSSRTLTGEIDDLAMPNGLCFSNDGRTLYVADSAAEMGPEIDFDPNGPRDVFQFEIGGDGRVSSRKRHFCRIAEGVPDGIRCDAEGTLWVATAAGVEAYASTGDRLGRIATGDTASNLAFGGRHDDRVMVTTETSAWIILL